MRKILTAGEMKGADEAAIRMGLPSLVLMERAALSVINAIDEEGLDTSAVLVVCGTGNNGGDGAAIARLLAERGSRVEVLFPFGKNKVSDQLKTQLQVLEYYDVPEVTGYIEGRYTLVVDALFGIGLSRDVTGPAADVMKAVSTDRAFVLAVDIASGLDGNSGRVCGCAVKADLTVTFAAAKRGHYLGNGKAYTGKLVIKKIGIPVDPKTPDFGVFAVEDRDFEELPDRDETGNKGTFGKLLVVAGSDDICGAAYFAAAAALKSGIGMVRIFTSEKNRIALSSLIPEALLTVYEEGAYERSLLENACEWADGIVCGPGLSVSETSARILSDLLEINRKPLVLDADALNLIAADPSLWDRIQCRCVITPHMGEMSRLCGKEIAVIKSDPVSYAAGIVKEHGITCVLKDAATVTAYESGDIYINVSGCSALATAGSGDVLSGIIGAFLLLYGETDIPVEALAVHRHGRIGEQAAARVSIEAVTAGTLLEALESNRLFLTK